MAVFALSNVFAAYQLAANTGFVERLPNEKESEVVPVRLPSAAASVKVPVAGMTRLLNVATPLTAATDAVVPPPKNMPPLSVTVTVEVSPVATLPKPSSRETCTAGLIDWPATPLLGACVYASFVAVAMMSN